jgi:hypothetical protein
MKITVKKKQYSTHTRKFSRQKQEEVYAGQCLALNNNMNQKEFFIPTLCPYLSPAVIK